MTDFEYVGQELTIFAAAENWKHYFGGSLREFISGDVLEVGAGLGATTEHLLDLRCRSWVCLEPDRSLADRLTARIAAGSFVPKPEVMVGAIDSLPPDRRFDTVLYIDVLEHIPDDREELMRAAARLRPGGRIIVLSPAYAWLYTPFDRAIGHVRRYTKATLEPLQPPGTRVRASFHLDSVGVLFNMVNLVARRTTPSRWTILLWDRAVIPVSRVVDTLIGRRAGRSVITVFERDSRDAGAAPFSAPAC